MLKNATIVAFFIVLCSMPLKAIDSTKEMIYTNSFEECSEDMPINIFFRKRGALQNWDQDTLRVVDNQPPDGKKSLQIDLKKGIGIGAVITLADDRLKFMKLPLDKTYSFSLYAKADRENAGVNIGFGNWKQSQKFKVGTKWKRLVYRFKPKKQSRSCVSRSSREQGIGLTLPKLKRGMSHLSILMR